MGAVPPRRGVRGLKTAVGWILDAYIQDETAVLWLRTDAGAVLRLTDTYAPRCYLLPHTEADERRLPRLLHDVTPITHVVPDAKYVTLGEDAATRLLRIHVDRAANYRRVIGAVAQLPAVKALYNTDLLHIQQYLFTQLGVAPTSKVAVEYTDAQRVAALTRLEDADEIPPPPFTSLFIALPHARGGRRPPPRHKPVTHLDVRWGAEAHVLRGREDAVLDQFTALVKAYDPDLLVSPAAGGTVAYLFDRATRRGPVAPLGRDAAAGEAVTSCRRWLRGRVVVDQGYMATYGVAGLVERARFGVLPPGIAARWTANRIIDSRNCYELLQRGHVIPPNLGGYTYVRTVAEVVKQDRGGLILAPAMGAVQANVAELDFESEYPHLIVQDGLSYETVTPHGVRPRADALLPHVTRQILARRLGFKRGRRRYAAGSPEWQWCEQRQLALKMILVCLYGTSGCCWNRFGNVLCFEEINRRSRETLVAAKTLVQQRGFDIVYADTDSLFVTKTEAPRAAYEALSEAIHRRLGLPIALDHHYKFFLLLPRRSQGAENMEAQKHYFGVLTDGTPLTRGIEARRHDCPPFIKAFQTALIRTLFAGETVADVYATGYPQAVALVDEAVNQARRAAIPLDDLVVSKTLRKPLTEYTSRPPHVAAATSLAHHDAAIQRGDTIDFIYVNAGHRNPLRRVAPRTLYAAAYYDREKYRRLILDAAETVLSPFGFTRHAFDRRPRGRTTQTTLVPT